MLPVRRSSRTAPVPLNTNSYLCSDYGGASGLKIDLQGARGVTLREVYGHLSLPVVTAAALENVLNLYHDVRADEKVHGEYHESTHTPGESNAQHVDCLKHLWGSWCREGDSNPHTVTSGGF